MWTRQGHCGLKLCLLFICISWVENFYTPINTHTHTHIDFRQMSHVCTLQTVWLMNVKLILALWKYQTFILSFWRTYNHTNQFSHRIRPSYLTALSVRSVKKGAAREKQNPHDKTFACWQNRIIHIYTWKKWILIFKQALIVATSRERHLHSEAVTTVCWSTGQMICKCRTGISFQKILPFTFRKAVTLCDFVVIYISLASVERFFFSQLPLTVWIAFPWRATNMPEHTSSNIFLIHRGLTRTGSSLRRKHS